MNLVPWGEYRPDVADLNGNHTRTISNVIPRGDGYGPVSSLEEFSDALGAVCRGAFRALNGDGTITLFAATATSLYQMDNATFAWTVVSKTAGAFTYTLPTDQVWQFAQFDDYVIAVQGGDVPQVFELGVSTYFADLGGSPPTAKYVSIINEFVVLTGLVAFPYRAHWSSRSDPAAWTAGVSECDFQDFGDGGPTGPMGGGEASGILLQTYAMRRMTYQPGNPVIFSFDRISEDIGFLAPYTMIKAGARIFFLSNAGFQMSVDGTTPTPIGKERIDNTFLGLWDDTQPQLCIGFLDPRGTRIYWAFKSNEVDGVLFDKILCYDYVLDKWSPIDSITGEFVCTMALVGQTLEGLDALPEVVVTSCDTHNGTKIIDTMPSTTGLYAGMWCTGTGIGVGAVISTVDSSSQVTLSVNSTASASVTLTFGGSLDSLDVPSLDAFPVAFGRDIAVFSSNHKLSFLTGSFLEAVLETPEQGEAISQQFTSGQYPISDAPTIYGQVSYRQNLGSTRAWNTEAARDSAGLIPARVDTRYSRFRNRVPSGEIWTYTTGVVPVSKVTGQR